MFPRLGTRQLGAMADLADRVRDGSRLVPSDLGYVVAEALEDERLLNSADPVVTATTDYTHAHLDRVAVSDGPTAALGRQGSAQEVPRAHCGKLAVQQAGDLVIAHAGASG